MADNDTEKLIKAMEDILLCESRYAVDPLKRAEYAIEHMQKIARDAIAAAKDGLPSVPNDQIGGRL